MGKTPIVSLLVLLVAALLAGCATGTAFTSDAPYREKKNDRFDLLVEPQLAEGYAYFNAFRFVFVNKTQRPLDILWSESFYLFNGKRNGLFGWPGMTFDDLEQLKARPDLRVAPGETVAEIIAPLRLLARKPADERIRSGGSGPEGQFTRGAFPEGRNGIGLTVRQDGETIRETVEFQIRRAPR